MDEVDITQLLAAWGDGDREAEALLLEIVHQKLREMVRRNLKREENRQLTLQTTEMLNELYIRLVGEVGRVEWQSRDHFFGIAARLIRHLAVDAARHKNASKRSALRPLALDMNLLAGKQGTVDFLALDEALTDLEGIDPQKAHLVHLRFFAGMTIEETAASMRVSTPTVKRMWRIAKAWLFNRLDRIEATQESDEPDRGNSL